MLPWQGTLINCIEDRTRQNCREDPLIAVQKGHPSSLKPFSEGIVGVTESTSGSRLGRRLMSKGLYMCDQSSRSRS